MLSEEDLMQLDREICHFDAVVDDCYDDVISRFPEAPICRVSISDFYHSAISCQSRRFIVSMNQINDPEIVNYLVNLKLDDVDGQSFTPLASGAMTGNLMFVRTLLSRYSVDLESECNVVFDGMVVYGATALWIAAAMGQLQIVKLLIKHGAAVNHNTKAQSSPLRAACYEGRLDIVKYLIKHGADVNLANTYNNTCIMIAAYRGHTDVVDTLLKNGAQPNDQALCGATALHYAAETKHLEVCRLLLDHGARLLDNEYKLTAVQHAADRTHEYIVDLFITRPGLMNKEEIITALELLGASFANDKDNYNLDKAYKYLLRAMEMRYEDPQNIIRKRLIAPVPAYDDWFETENIAELKAIRLNHHSMHMESLTIRERVLGKSYPELPQAIVYRGAVMADHGRFTQCQTLWNYAIDLRMVNNISVERDLLRFAQLFSQMLRLPNQTVDLTMVLSVLGKCQQEIMNNKYKIANPGPKDVPRLLRDQNDQNLMSALYLIKIVTILIARLPKEELPKEHFRQIYTTMTNLIKCDTRLADGKTLLHMAVNGITQVDDFHTNEVCKFPCYRTAMLLVRFGASLHATDIERNTPLHTLIATYPRTDDPRLLKNTEDTIKLFIHSGAHVDAVNAQNQTPAQIYNSSTLSNIVRSYENNYISLKCLASRCIAFHRLSYVGQIPTALEAFVQMHSAAKPEALMCENQTQQIITESN